MFKQITEGLCCQKEGQYTYSNPKNGGKYDAVKGRQRQITQQPQKHKKAHAVRRSFIVGLYIRTSKRVRRDGCQQEREETNEN